MKYEVPRLRQFRVEIRDNGLAHLVFDAPGRRMNVLSNAAIHELAEFARWLGDSEVTGVVIRSGKDTAFCVGADLSELGVAYDLLMQAPPRLRFDAAFEHFFPLSAAIRALESAGKPVAAAIAGLALGGGCELALGAHHRVLVDDPGASLGLPESLVGLLPGAGGTQRLPRLIGIDAALPVLLRGARLSGQAALDARLVDALAAPGEEIAMAENWLLANAGHRQPWDGADWIAPSPLAVSTAIAPVREQTLIETLGHYPAPLAILDCVEFGLVQCFDGAIRSEMSIFSHLIQRGEPRNMIQTLFLGKAAYERCTKGQDAPAFVAQVVSAVRAVLAQSSAAATALAAAGFVGMGEPATAAVRRKPLPGYWVEGAEADPRQEVSLAVLQRISEAVSPWAGKHTPEELRMADFVVVRDTGYPAYLGGPFAFAARTLG